MSNPATTIQVEYHIAPLTGIDTSSLSVPREAILSSTLPETLDQSYYSKLARAVNETQGKLNDTLTIWKDAVGETERFKESAEKGRRQPLEVEVSEVAVEEEEEGSSEEE